MNKQDFVNNYNMHDSLINDISYSKEKNEFIMVIDFAFWMQKNYQPNKPETGLIKVKFSNLKKIIVPEDMKLDDISIIQTLIENDSLKFSLMNDITDEYLEIIIDSDNIEISELNK
ncbi:MAG: hypothetical protein IKQ33_04360 [Clostridia bacterium]|jgi:hypothetical protein|nr:hypothetical protein [Clostridia bacterium]